TLEQQQNMPILLPSLRDGYSLLPLLMDIDRKRSLTFNLKEACVKVLSGINALRGFSVSSSQYPRKLYS
ncbi:hypothetical protein J6590_095570, partial [Homalodisca vitripennis]